MKLSLLSLGLLIGGLAACGPKVTMAGAGVHLAKARSEVTGCQPISAVASTQGSEEKAEADLRNRAGDLNANWVLIDDKVENGGAVNLKGTAYTCPKDMGAAAGGGDQSGSGDANSDS